jgi:hypothetical protein
MKVNKMKNVSTNILKYYPYKTNSRICRKKPHIYHKTYVYVCSICCLISENEVFKLSCTYITEL